jgi:hypothetical protein
MNSNIHKIILFTTIFAAAVALSVSMLATTTGGPLILASAFAQGENMSSGGNYTEGNMTGSDMAGSEMATPPPMTP